MGIFEQFILMYQDSAQSATNLRPPLNYQPAATSQSLKQFANQPLSSTARSQVTLGQAANSTNNSKWSINIQEIVKRTQRNLERGTSASSTGANGQSQQINTATRNTQNLSNYDGGLQDQPSAGRIIENTNLSGGGSGMLQKMSSASLINDDTLQQPVQPGQRSTNLYRELKQKLSTDSTKMSNSQSTKLLGRPQSAVGTGATGKNLLSKHLLQQRENQNLSRDRSGTLMADQFYNKSSQQTMNQGAPSVQSGQGQGDNQLTHLDEEDQEDLEAQLILMGGGLKAQNKNLTLNQQVNQQQVELKRVSEVENRQKIFEDEIIKRIKEIQRYTKSLHLQIKKQSQSFVDLEDQQVKFEKTLYQQQKRFQLLPDSANQHNDLQLQIDDLRNDMLPQMISDLHAQLKQELQMKISQDVRSHAERIKAPALDTLKLQEDIFARTQELITDAVDAQPFRLFIDEFKQKLTTVQVTQSQHQKELKQLALKVDKVDLRIDNCQDQISQQLNQSQEDPFYNSQSNTNSNGQIAVLKQELLVKHEEFENRVLSKLQISQKQQQAKFTTELDRRVLELQTTLQEKGGISTDLQEWYEEVEQRLESQHKLIKQELDQQKLDSSNNTGGAQLSAFKKQVTSCQQSVLLLEERVQSISFEAVQESITEQIDGSEAHLQTEIKTKLLAQSEEFENKLAQFKDYIMQQQIQLSHNHSSQANSALADELMKQKLDLLQDEMQQLSQDQSNKLEELEARIQAERTSQQKQIGVLIAEQFASFDLEIQSQLQAMKTDQSQTTANLQSEMKKIANMDQESAYKSLVEQVTHLQNVVRAQSESAELQTLANHVHQVSEQMSQVDIAGQQTQHATLKIQQSLKSHDSQLGQINAQLDTVYRLTRQLDQQAQMVTELKAQVTESDAKFEKRVSEIKPQTQPEERLQTTQMLSLENMQLQLDDQQESLIDLSRQISTLKQKNAQPAEDTEVKRSGSFLAAASEKQLTETVQKDVMQTLKDEIKTVLDVQEKSLHTFDQKITEELERLSFEIIEQREKSQSLEISVEEIRDKAVKAANDEESAQQKIRDSKVQHLEERLSQLSSKLVAMPESKGPQGDTKLIEELETKLLKNLQETALICENNRQTVVLDVKNLKKDLNEIEDSIFECNQKIAQVQKQSGSGKPAEKGNQEQSVGRESIEKIDKQVQELRELLDTKIESLSTTVETIRKAQSLQADSGELTQKIDTNQVSLERKVQDVDSKLSIRLSQMKIENLDSQQALKQSLLKQFADLKQLVEAKMYDSANDQSRSQIGGISEDDLAQLREELHSQIEQQVKALASKFDGKLVEQTQNLNARIAPIAANPVEKSDALTELESCLHDLAKRVDELESQTLLQQSIKSSSFKNSLVARQPIQLEDSLPRVVKVDDDKLQQPFFEQEESPLQERKNDSVFITDDLAGEEVLANQNQHQKTSSLDAFLNLESNSFAQHQNNQQSKQPTNDNQAQLGQDQQLTDLLDLTPAPLSAPKDQINQLDIIFNQAGKPLQTEQLDILDASLKSARQLQPLCDDSSEGDQQDILQLSSAQQQMGRQQQHGTSQSELGNQEDEDEEDGCSSIVLPSQLQNKQLDKQSFSKNTQGAIAALQVSSENDSQDLMPMSAHSNSIDQRNSIHMSEDQRQSQSLGGILDSGNFYESAGSQQLQQPSSPGQQQDDDEVVVLDQQLLSLQVQLKDQQEAEPSQQDVLVSSELEGINFEPTEQSKVAAQSNSQLEADLDSAALEAFLQQEIYSACLIHFNQ